VAWSQEFVEALRKPARPIFRLENLSVTTLDNGWALSSHTVGAARMVTDEVMTQEGTSFSSAELTLRTWASSVGTFSVGFTGPGWKLIPRMTRGQWVALKVGFIGWEYDQFQTVCLGTLWNVRGHSNEWVIECRDALSGLVHRQDGGSSDDRPAPLATYSLFSTVTASTSLTSPYTLGDPTLNVASTTGFERQDDGSGALKGAIRLTSGSTTFLLTYTGKTATTFTGLSALGVVGTTATSLGTADVTEVAYLDDHPIDAARRWLVGSGSYAWLPAAWSLNLPDWMIDHVDCDRSKTYSSVSSGLNIWEFVAEDTEEDGRAFIDSQIAAGGFFITVRQGRLTVRCVVDPNLSTVPYISTLDDGDILEIEDFEAFDSSLQTEYESYRVEDGAGGGSTQTETVGSFPVDGRATITIAAYSNGTNHQTAVRTRCAPWYLRVPERLVIRCAMRCAQFAPGDVVLISSARIVGRTELTSTGYSGRRAMVTAVAPDWFGWTCTISLSVLPSFSSATLGGS
jgi:hypothetical protein